MWSLIQSIRGVTDMQHSVLFPGQFLLQEGPGLKVQRNRRVLTSLANTKFRGNRSLFSWTQYFSTGG